MNWDQKWPDALWIVRHGESAGNVARDAAQKAGLPVIGIALRDVDVPLSPLSERQAAAPGRWFHAISPDELFNDVAPLQVAGQKVTKEPDAKGVTG